MNNILLIGDVHGQCSPFKKLRQRLKNNEHYTIICLGDFSANYFLNERDEFFKEELRKYNFTYFVIRGNHEMRPSILFDTKTWGLKEFFNGPVMYEYNFPYILYASDFVCSYIINNLKTLIIPGAYSVDKYYRLENNLTWFKDEQLTIEEQQRGLKVVSAADANFDLILSHTCPLEFQPTDLFLSCIDQMMVDTSMERYLNYINKLVNYKYWCWGHYHKFRDYGFVEDGSALEEKINSQKRRMIMLYDRAIRLDDLINNKTENLLI